MDTTPDARRSIERAAAFAEPHARREMRSHLFEAAERRAKGRDGSAIEQQDVERALHEAGGVEALALALSRRGPPSATLARRAAAHALDLALLYGALLGLWVVAWLASVGLAHLDLAHVEVPTPSPYQIIDVDDVPWTRGAPLGSLLYGAALGAYLVGIPFVYFLVSDLRGGRTLAKRALGLRARRVTTGHAVIRAALKCTPLLAPLLPFVTRLASVADEREAGQSLV